MSSWDIGSGSYTGNNYLLSGTAGTFKSIFIKPNISAYPARYWVISNYSVKQYSNPGGDVNSFDVSLSNPESTFDLSSQSTTPLGITFSQDGSKMYVSDLNTYKIFQYTLLNPWDLSSGASYSGKYLYVASTAYQGISFDPSGLFLYVARINTIYRYELSVAWDITTALYYGVYMSTASQETSDTAVTYSYDGKIFYVLGTVHDTVFEYKLSTAWDISTGSYSGRSMSGSSQDSSMVGMNIASDGRTVLLVGNVNNKAYQYRMTADPTLNPMQGGGVLSASPKIIQNLPGALSGSGTLLASAKLTGMVFAGLSGVGSIRAQYFGTKWYDALEMVADSAAVVNTIQKHSVGNGDVVTSGSGSLKVDAQQVLSLLTLFNYEDTVISQYANSPIILQMIDALNQSISQGNNWYNFFNLVWNVDTAVGWGLDRIGRVVGASRVLPVVTNDKYIGFHEAGDLNGGRWGTAPWYAGQALTNNFSLSDSAFRLLIYAKALLNLTNTSIASINQALLALFPGRGACYVRDNGDMSMTYKFEFATTPVEKSVLLYSGVLPKPSGVTIYYDLP